MSRILLNNRKASFSQKQQKKIHSFSFLITDTPNTNSITLACFAFLSQTFLCCTGKPAHRLQDHKYTLLFMLFSFSVLSFLGSYKYIFYVILLLVLFIIILSPPVLYLQHFVNLIKGIKGFYINSYDKHHEITGFRQMTP